MHALSLKFIVHSLKMSNNLVLAQMLREILINSIQTNDNKEISDSPIKLFPLEDFYILKVYKQVFFTDITDI